MEGLAAPSDSSIADGVASSCFSEAEASGTAELKVTPAMTRVVRRQAPASALPHQHGAELVLTHVRVFWADEGPLGKWFKGQVREFDRVSGYHTVVYDDGEQRREPLNHQGLVWEIIEEEDEVSVMLSCTSTAIHSSRRSNRNEFPEVTCRKATAHFQHVSLGPADGGERDSKAKATARDVARDPLGRVQRDEERRYDSLAQEAAARPRASAFGRYGEWSA